ncbi:uncharacterized protein LOC122679668 [Cervus elaphus]|uniref:uncharacterized protein LOC122451492 n=1 Tax=Cervus canadensis TaxID=1574408 RepID=UPI001C9E98D8|nr:uncharacterized protein LOC122451492 [Cervus canadensis]XP_043736476.1 uncharacterized protein LOC122679668 [Cervus elaphus]
MVMELRNCPLSAQQLPGRGLFRGSPGEAGPGGKAVNAGERDPPPPLRKGKKKDRASAPALSARARWLRSPPRPRFSASLAGTRPDPGARRAERARGLESRSCRRRLARLPAALRTAPRLRVGRGGAAPPFPSLGPLRRQSATGARGPGRMPRSQTPPARPPARLAL